VKLLLDEQISGKVGGLSDPDLFEVAQQQGRALVTYNRVDFEPIIREYVQMNHEHHGLVIVHPIRFPSWEFAPLISAIESLLAGADPGMSALLWLQNAGD
jgi:hypothetical protein